MLLHIPSKLPQQLSGYLLLSLLVPSAHALEASTPKTSALDGISLSVGLEFDSGDYGTADTTDTWRIPFSLQYQKGAFFAGASMPYIDTRSTGTIILSNNRNSHQKGPVTRSSNTSVSKASGFGDLTLSAGYRFPASEEDSLIYNISVHIKLATADENKGLGSGENDYAIEAGLSNYFDKYSLFASVGYQFNGDTATINYDNTLYANIGFGVPQSNGNQLGAMLDYSQAASAGFDDALELSGFIDIPVSSQRSLYFYLLTGLSDGSPDYGLGANYRFNF